MYVGPNYWPCVLRLQAQPAVLRMFENAFGGSLFITLNHKRRMEGRVMLSMMERIFRALLLALCASSAGWAALGVSENAFGGSLFITLNHKRRMEEREMSSMMERI